MKKTIYVMFREIQVTLGRKSFTIIGFGLPILIGIVVVVIILANKDKIPDVVSTLTPLSQTQEKLGYVDEGDLISFIPRDVPSAWFSEFADEEAAQEALDSGEIEAYYIISPDYVRSGSLDYVTRRFNIFGGRTHCETLEWILLANLIGDSDLASSLRQPANLQVNSLAATNSEAAEDSWIVELFPTFMTLMLYFAIVLSSSVLVTSVTDEKKNRVMEVLISSVSTGQMITGKILGVAILGLLLLLAWLGVFLLVALFGGKALQIPANFSVPVDVLLWAGVFGLLGYAIYGALMAGLGALAPDVKDTRSATFVVLAPLILAYMLMMFVSTEPEGPLALGLSLFPLTSPVSMIGRMAVSDVPIWQSLLALFLQLMAAFFIIKLVIRLFRAQTLLSGQPFGVGRFLGALAGRS